MKTLSPELAAVCYSQNVAFVADLFTITLASGTVLRWTPFDVSLAFGGNTWTNPGVVLNTPTFRDALGVDQIAAIQLSLVSATVTICGISVQQAAVAGAFERARIDIYRTYMTSPGTVPGIVQKFSGEVSDVEPGSLMVRLTARSDLHKLEQMLPKRITSAQCPYAVYSPECGASTVARSATLLTGAGCTRKLIYFDIPISQPTNSVSVDGWVSFGSGPLAGRSATIGALLPGGAAPITGVELYSSLPSAPAAGTTITVYRGCNKHRTDCGTVFGRLASYGGFPEMPAEETV